MAANSNGHRRFAVRASFTVGPRRFYGLRGWAGKPSHPPLAALPLGGYVLAAAFELTSLLHPVWTRDAVIAATWVQAGSFLVALLAAFTGFLDRRASDPGTQARRTVNTHAALMICATLLAASCLWLRFHGGDHRLVLALSLAVAVAVIAGAWVGLDLVYEMGYRVENAHDSPHWHPWSRDVLPGGGPRRWYWPMVEGGDGEHLEEAGATIRHS